MNGTTLADVIDRRRSEILDRWSRREHERALRGEPREVVLDDLPDFLSATASVLRRRERARGTPGPVPEVVESSRKHGRGRSRRGADLGVVQRDYQALRDVLFDVIRETEYAPSLEELRVLGDALTAGVGEAVEAFAEERTRSLAEATREQDETVALLDAVIERAPVALALFDTSMRITRTNQAMASIDRAPIEAHLGRRMREVNASLAEHVEPMIERVVRTGTMLLDVEVTTPGAAGRRSASHWLVSAYPVELPGGRPFIAGVVVVDVTEKTERAEELRRAAEFRERFLGIVAHDLRTPLAAIATGASLLLRLEALPEGALRIARRISSSAEDMARMISELFDFTRARLGGGVVIQREPAALTEIVHRAVDDVNAAQPTRTIRLEVDDAFVGAWDPLRLSRVVANLVKNALDYSPPATAITLSLLRARGGVELRVHNENASGAIPREQLATLFDPFRRLAEPGGGVRDGLGLGLYISREIALAHGGTIDVTSLAEGTTVVVWLPIAPAPPRS